MTEQERIEADVPGRVAFIDDCVEGNLSASDSVILNSNARVAGEHFHTIIDCPGWRPVSKGVWS